MNQYKPTGFKTLPTVIKNLLIINGLLFLAQYTFKEVLHLDLADYLGLHYFSAEKFMPFQFITYMFLHSIFDFSHLLFNMFALWMFGKVLENFWGAKRFLIYYLVTGVGAAIVHYAVFYFQVAPTVALIDNYINNPSIIDFKNFIESGNFQVISYEIQDNINTFLPKYNNLINTHPSQALSESVSFMQQYKIDFLNAPVVIGASGAVFGLLLAFGMMFPNSMIYVYFAIPVKAKWFVVIYGALELYMGFQSNDNVAHFAHLGGMLFGFILLKIWKRNQFNKHLY